MTDKANRYNEADHHATLELAASIGISQAGRHLGISRKTIYTWIDKYPKLWSDLKANDPNAGRRGIAQKLEDLADRYGASENDLLQKIEDGELAPKDAREAAALLKAMSSGRHAAVAGVRTISGEAEVVEHNINFPQLEKAMQAILDQAPAPPLLVTNEAEDVDQVRDNLA